MFTGIVEEIGKVAAIVRDGDGWNLSLSANRVLGGIQLGDSIAVNGTCLTVTTFNDHGFTATVSPETRTRTNLAGLRVSDAVNLERSVTPNTRMGGHFVQGHVDGVATIATKRDDGEALWLTFRVAAELLKYVVVKGYVCLDGASLTVVETFADGFSVMLVPFTRTHITLGDKKVGGRVNLEVDIIGKYVEKLLGSQSPASSPITLATLKESGFD